MYVVGNVERNQSTWGGNLCYHSLEICGQIKSDRDSCASMRDLDCGPRLPSRVVFWKLGYQ